MIKYACEAAKPLYSINPYTKKEGVEVKKIVFIGDSIMYGVDLKGMKGYGFYVREALRRRAEVILPLENCQDTRFTFSVLSELFEPGELEGADLIYWNNGLWDVMHFGNNATPVVPKERYGLLLERIFVKLKELSPDAKIIFATTTPVIEERYTSLGIHRKNAEILGYTCVAREVLGDKVALIDDLYSVASNFPHECRSEDPTHFSELGSQKLAEHILALIDTMINGNVKQY